MFISDWQTVKVLHEQRLEDVKEEQTETRKESFLRLPRIELSIRLKRNHRTVTNS